MKEDIILTIGAIPGVIILSCSFYLTLLQLISLAFIIGIPNMIFIKLLTYTFK